MSDTGEWILAGLIVAALLWGLEDDGAWILAGLIDADARVRAASRRRAVPPRFTPADRPGVPRRRLGRPRSPDSK